MEFWGTEVAPGKPQVSDPGEETYVHVSQAALGPSKDGKSERVVIRVETGGKNVVLGTLVAGKVDQMSLDLIFDRDFKLSHTSTSASVFFCGYKTEKQLQEDFSSEESDEDVDEEDDEEVPAGVPIKENGIVAGKDTPKAIKTLKEAERAVEARAKKAEKGPTGLLDLEAEEGSSEEDEDDEDSRLDMKSDVRMDIGSDDYDEDDDSELELDEDDVSDEDGSDELDEDDSEDEVSDEDEDEVDEDDDEEKTPDAKLLEIGKKRAQINAAQKSPAAGKKARVDTPAKPGRTAAAEHWESLIGAGQKGLITTPAKKGSAVAKVSGVKEVKEAVVKTPSKEKEAAPKTPKSVGESAKKLGPHKCVDCDRSFTSDSALSQHAKAKHNK